MGLDWGYAGQVGGIGFGMVFLLLIILMIVIILTGVIINKIEARKSQPTTEEKGE